MKSQNVTMRDVEIRKSMQRWERELKKEKVKLKE